jgi:hypothetical protein
VVPKRTEPRKENTKSRENQIEYCEEEDQVLKEEIRVLAKKGFATALGSECTRDSSERGVHGTTTSTRT